MANTLGVYNPIFYAQEALIQLEKALGMAGRVYMGYDEERRSFGRGETISIRKPSTFTVQDAPSTAQDVQTETVTLTLNNWKEVKFKLSDKELAFTGERIINDHIRPAAYALADNIDIALATLYQDIPWFHTLNATPGSVVTDITGPHQILFDNAVPMDDLHYMVNGALQNGFLANAAFAQWQGAGATGEATRVKSNDKSGTISITLQQSSPSNDDLSTIALADELSNTGLRPFLMKDNLGTTIYTAPTAFIEKIPAGGFGKTQKDRVWVIKTNNLIAFLGGNA